VTEILRLVLPLRRTPILIAGMSLACLIGCGPKPNASTGMPNPPASRTSSSNGKHSESVSQSFAGPDHRDADAAIDTTLANGEEAGLDAEENGAGGSTAQDWLFAAEEALDLAGRRLDANDRAGYEQAMVDAHHALWRAETAFAEDPQALAILTPIYEKLIADLREGFTVAESPAEPASEAVEDLEATPAELAGAPPAPAAAPTNFDMPIDPDNPLVAKYLALFQEGQRRRYLEETFERSDRYRDMVLRELHAAGLPEELWAVPIIESGYKVNAYSRTRAVGLWQFMTTTARNYGLVVNEWVDERRDPVKSTKAALVYLKDLYSWFNSWDFALAAYNRGEFGIQRDIERSRIVDFMEMAELGATHRETENHVPQIHAAAIIAKAPEKYGFHLGNAAPVPMDTVSIDYVVDLSVVATCAGTSEEEIRDLNPELRKWVTPILSRDYPTYTLKLPAGSADRYQREITDVADRTPRRQVQYTVRRGDTVAKVAARFGVSPSDLREWNNLRSNKLRRGTHLVVMPPKGKKRSPSTDTAVADASTSSSHAASAGGGASGTTLHTVRRGDTLYDIAMTYGTTVSNLKELNGIRGSGKIYPGQKLRVPATD
jgi:membrane-bound lytic murein transglycosylase D